LLNVGRDVHWLNVEELNDPVPITPGGELARCPKVRPTRMPVANLGGEELDETSGARGGSREETRQRAQDRHAGWKSHRRGGWEVFSQQPYYA
jgi:hypothetical protein